MEGRDTIMKYLMFDRGGVKFFFPRKNLFIEYLSCLVPEAVSKASVKKFLLGLDKEEGVYTTIIWSDGSIREDSAFDYYKDLVRFLDKEGRLYG